MNKGYSVKDITVVHRNPNKRQLAQNNRIRAAFFFIVKGEFIFETKVGTFCAKENDAVYLPKKSDYSFVITSETAEVIITDFEPETDEEVVISVYPEVIQVGGDGKRLFYDLHRAFYKNEQYAVLSNLFGIAAMFEMKLNKNDDLGKIGPAVKYLEANFDKVVSVKELAVLCGLSESHFRSLFREKMKMSPVKYKNALLMRYASALLKSEDMNISEVAEYLNFCSIYAFSRAFKKEMGISPKKYTQTQ